MHLDRKQRRAVECVSSNCLVLACPGSGKSRVLVSKTDHILKVDRGAHVMCLSFTKDSAAELRRRIVETIGKEAAKRVATGTFHGMALDMLRRHAATTNTTIGSIIGPGQMRQYVERALAEARIQSMELDDAAALIEELKMTPDYEPGGDERGRLFAAYVAITERNRVIDFADMLSRTVRMMKSGDILPKKAKYLLTDESQDMDAMQYAWCKAHIENGSIFTVVGDDDQSIYKFRRAMGYHGMMKFNEDFGAEMIRLDTNYRCHSEILDSAARLIVNNEERVAKDLNAARGAGGHVSAWLCDEPQREAELAVSKIIEISGTGDASYAGGMLIIPDGEWAILARNGHNLKRVCMELKANGIAYTYAGKDMWSEQPVCLALGLLSSLVTGHKSGFDAALHFAGMDEEVLVRLHKDFGDDFEQLFYGGSVDFEQYGSGTAESLREFVKQVPQWHKSLGKDRVNLVINGTFNWFVQNMSSNRDDSARGRSFERDLDSLEAARDLLTKMDGDLPKRLSRVMASKDSSTSSRDKDGGPKAGGGVYCGTMHSSKGLEFTNVWVLGVNKETIPSSGSSDPSRAIPLTQEIIEEERRLFYVAMTRAKDMLFISCSGSPSPFIEETGIALTPAFKAANYSDSEVEEA